MKVGESKAGRRLSLPGTIATETIDDYCESGEHKSAGEREREHEHEREAQAATLVPRGQTTNTHFIKKDNTHK